jgi:hypothetical protein
MGDTFRSVIKGRSRTKTIRCFCNKLDCLVMCSKDLLKEFMEMNWLFDDLEMHVKVKYHRT